MAYSWNDAVRTLHKEREREALRKDRERIRAGLGARERRRADKRAEVMRERYRMAGLFRALQGKGMTARAMVDAGIVDFIGADAGTVGRRLRRWIGRRVGGLTLVSRMGHGHVTVWSTK